MSMGRRRLQRKIIWRRIGSIRGRDKNRRKYIHKTGGCNSLKQHPNLVKEEVHDIMKSIYNEKYCRSNQIVLHYWELIRNQASTQGAGVMETHPEKYSRCTRSF
jgi:hypothetical protein